MKNKGMLLAISILTFGMAGISVQAGSINAAEAGIISAASGTFEYNGRSYVAASEYLGQLNAKLSEDGVDLSAQQASSLTSQMYASVGEGVAQGYLVPVDGSEPGEDETDADKKPSQKQDKGTNGEPADPQEDSGTADGPSTDASSSSAKQKDKETLLADIKKDDQAKDYQGQDITAIARKDETDRTEEEEKALQNYLSAKAVEELTQGAVKEKENVLLKNAPYIGLGVLLLAAAAAIFFFIKNIVQKKKGHQLAGSIEPGYTDIHCHILPGVDDGAKDIQMAMQMIESEYAQGVRKIILTPHYTTGHHQKTVQELKNIFETLQGQVKEQFSDMQLYLGNEIFYSDSSIAKLEAGEALTLAGSRYVLVEYKPDESYSRILNSVIKLQRQRYYPIIAHVERYENVIKNHKHLKELKDTGALLQMNCRHVRKYQKYIKTGFIDFLATDCHDLEHRVPDMKEGVLALCECCGADTYQNLLVKNSEKILPVNTTKER